MSLLSRCRQPQLLEPRCLNSLVSLAITSIASIEGGKNVAITPSFAPFHTELLGNSSGSSCLLGWHLLLRCAASPRRCPGFAGKRRSPYWISHSSKCQRHLKINNSAAVLKSKDGEICPQ